MNYYAVRLGGDPLLVRHGGPATLYRFQSKQERDEFVATRSYTESIPANHIWVKQAKYKIQQWVDERKGRKFPKNWSEQAILLVNFDMTKE